MGIKFANFVSTRIANTGGIDQYATSFDVAPGDGALFPALAAGDYFYIVVVRDTGAREIMKVTGRVGDTLMNLHRGQDGTSAIPFNQGDTVELRVTAASLVALMGESGASQEDVAQAVMDFSNKTFIDGLRVTGGDILLSPASGVTARLRAGTVSDTELQLLAGGYTDPKNSGVLTVRSKDHASLPGTVSLAGGDGTNSREGLQVKSDGTVSIPLGLLLGPNQYNMVPTSEALASRVPIRDVMGRAAFYPGAIGSNDAVVMSQFASAEVGGYATGIYPYSGYMQLPDGFTIMWGNGKANTNIYFPIAFPSTCLTLLISFADNLDPDTSGISLNTSVWQPAVAPTYFHCTAHGTTSQLFEVNWWALGR